MNAAPTKDPSKIIIVAGPTASGKSAAGVALAHALASAGTDAEIVSLDSVQVFREFEIGSAKISSEEQRGIPHHLLGVLSPFEKLDAQKFLEMARASILGIQSKGKIPVIVGGTTMYLTMLLHGLSSVPQVDGDLRDALAAQSDESLYAELLAGDPQTAARLHVHDRTRVLRAVESLRTRGVPLSQIHAEHGFRDAMYRALILVPCWNRKVLYERINERTRQMIEGGLLDETKSLKERYGQELHGFRALGYRQALEVLTGVLPGENLESSVAQFTRNFAKRQLTYFRNEPGKRGWAQRPEQLGPQQLGPEELREQPPSKRSDRSKLGTAKGPASPNSDFLTLRLSPQALAEAAIRWWQSAREVNEIWYLDAEMLSSADCRPAGD